MLEVNYLLFHTCLLLSLILPRLGTLSCAECRRYVQLSHSSVDGNIRWDSRQVLSIILLSGSS